MSADAPEAVEITGEPTAVYRFYDAAGTLLYVGITCNLPSRWASHRADKMWWPRVTKRTVVMYGSREEAESAELAAIRSESPLYNVVGVHAQPKPPRRNLRALADNPAALQAELRRLRRQPPLTVSFDAEFQVSIDAYAQAHGLARDHAAAVLMLLGLMKAEEEAAAYEAEMAALRAELEVEIEAKVRAEMSA